MQENDTFVYTEQHKNSNSPIQFYRMAIAGIRIEVECLYRRSAFLCKDFFCGFDKPDIIIRTSMNEIEKSLSIMRETLKVDDCFRGIISADYGEIESSIVCFKTAESLLDFDSILFHAAAVAYNNKAYLFSAPSGTGKTTHIRKWLEYLPVSFVVNGDKPFIKLSSEFPQPLACGSPWAGKENMYTNTMVPLKSIIFMERAANNHIEQIAFTEAFPLILQQVYRPDDEAKMRKTLHLVQRLNPMVTFWRFRCNNFKDDCFDVAYNALVKDQK